MLALDCTGEIILKFWTCKGCLGVTKTDLEAYAFVHSCPSSNAFCVKNANLKRYSLAIVMRGKRLWMPETRHRRRGFATNDYESQVTSRPPSFKQHFFVSIALLGCSGYHHRLIQEGILRRFSRFTLPSGMSRRPFVTHRQGHDAKDIDIFDGRTRGAPGARKYTSF